MWKTLKKTTYPDLLLCSIVCVAVKLPAQTKKVSFEKPSQRVQESQHRLNFFLVSEDQSSSAPLESCGFLS